MSDRRKNAGNTESNHGWGSDERDLSNPYSEHYQGDASDGFTGNPYLQDRTDAGGGRGLGEDRGRFDDQGGLGTGNQSLPPNSNDNRMTRGFDSGINGQGDYEANRRPDADFGMTNGTKLMWIAAGMLAGVFSLLLVFFLFMGRDPNQRRAAFRYSFIGVCAGIVVELIYLYVTGALPAMVANGGMPGAATQSQGLF